MSGTYEDNPDMPYQVRVGAAILWNDEVVACGNCGQSEGLIMTAFAKDPATSFQCLNRHTWFREDIPGTFVQTIYRRSAADPEAESIIIHLGEER